MKTITTTLLIFLASHFSHALENPSYYEDDSYYSYDALVDQLSMDNPQREKKELMKDYENVYFQVGAGFSQSLLNISGQGASDTIGMNGIEIRGAMNLFSPYWLVEGTVRNYNNANSSKATYELREFEMKFTHFTPLSSKTFYRVTSGLAARFLKTNIETLNSTKTYNTPALILGGGAGYNINPRMAIVGDLAFKTSLIQDTVDKNVLDFTVRLDTRF